jgi:hypothetical protein
MTTDEAALGAKAGEEADLFSEFSSEPVLDACAWAAEDAAKCQ